MEFRLEIFQLGNRHEINQPKILVWKKLAVNFGLKNVTKFHAKIIGLKRYFGRQMY